MGVDCQPFAFHAPSAAGLLGVGAPVPDTVYTTARYTKKIVKKVSCLRILYIDLRSIFYLKIVKNIKKYHP